MQAAHSWSANTAPLKTAVYPLTPGLYLTNSSGKTGGIPTAAGTSNITITAWETSSNTGGQVSSVFTFTITAATGPPMISEAPASQSVLRGNTSIFTVGASGADPLSYRWKFGGTDIANATNATLTLSNVQATNSGVYTVIITNLFGSATTNAMLTVILPPAITSAPTSQSVAPGTTVNLTVTASGTAPLNYRWQYNGANIFGGTNASLPLNNVQSTNSGTYTIIVSNPYGTTNSASMLTVTGSPGIITQPENKAVAQGGTATFTVLAGGEFPLGYQWFKEGVPLPGKTFPSLSISGVKQSDAGRYTVGARQNSSARPLAAGNHYGRRGR